MKTYVGHVLVIFTCLFSINLFAGGKLGNSKTMKLNEGETVTLDDGKRIKFVGTGSRSGRPPRAGISMPASHLAIYELAVTSADPKAMHEPKKIFLSFSHGGMVTNQSEDFENVTIRYIGVEYPDGKNARLELRVEPAKEP